MEIPIVSITRRRVQCAIDSNAKLLSNFACKAKRQLGALIDVKLAGECEHNFSRQNGITPTVVHLNAIPEVFSVAHKSTTWQMNARIKHAVSTAVVEDLPGALISDQRTGTVCGGGGRGAAAGAGDGCACAQMKNGHTRDPLRCRGAVLTARNHAKHDYSKCALRG